MTKKHQEWSWEVYHLPCICWCYLKFTDQLWNLKETAFEGKELKSASIEECSQSVELLGLHNYWWKFNPFAIKDRKKRFFHHRAFQQILIGHMQRNLDPKSP